MVWRCCKRILEEHVWTGGFEVYIPRHFEETRTEVLHELIRAHPLGTLVTMTDAGLEANHIPFVLVPEPAPLGTLGGHVARANAVWKEFRPDVEALVIFQGPHSYITPTWYPSKQQSGEVVPTWNYAVVHARGLLRVIEDPDWLARHLHSLTDEHEAGRAAPWRVTDAPAAYVEKLTRAIVGIEISITRLLGKWKVSQNRSKADRGGVVDGLRQEGSGDAKAMADLVQMRSLNNS